MAGLGFYSSPEQARLLRLRQPWPEILQLIPPDEMHDNGRVFRGTRGVRLGPCKNRQGPRDSVHGDWSGGRHEGDAYPSGPLSVRTKLSLPRFHEGAKRLQSTRSVKRQLE
jgi:hypothetical protein